MIEIKNSTIGNFVGGDPEQSTPIIGGGNSSTQLVDANADENRNRRAISRLSQAVRPSIIISFLIAGCLTGFTILSNANGAWELIMKIVNFLSDR